MLLRKGQRILETGSDQLELIGLSYWLMHTHINKLSPEPETCYLVISHWDYSKYKKILFIFFLSSYLTFYLLNCILIITVLSWIPVLHALLCFLSYLWSEYLFQFSSCENWDSEIPNATELVSCRTSTQTQLFPALESIFFWLPNVQFDNFETWINHRGKKCGRR